MASHGSTSSDFMYDVFLSFRCGVRHAFTDHLCQALLNMGIKTFRDDEEQKAGDEIRSDLEKIEHSRMSMVVLCEYYASSTRCLDELAKIIDCYDHKGKQVLAIFYKVEPADVRKQRNSIEAAMIEHEKRFGKDSEKVKSWRSALSRVCDLSGLHCRDYKYESELIEKIVKDTSAKLPPVPLEIKWILGFVSRFEEVKSLIDLDSNDTVRVLGIHGPRGIGKTTFAGHMYNKIRHQFQAASFVANIGEKSKLNGLEDLQTTLLAEMGEKTQTMRGNTIRGGQEIKRKLGRKRVLLVLDDVDNIKQLESLAGEHEWFGSGSRIIITTRDTTLLDKHDVEITKYEMKELNDHDSLELFCWYAFGTSEPAENFADIATHAVTFAKGFPLALKVLGSKLKDLTIEEWEMELDKYKKVANAFSFLLNSF